LYCVFPTDHPPATFRGGSGGEAIIGDRSGAVKRAFRAFFSRAAGVETACIARRVGHRCAMSSNPPPDAGGLYQAALNHIARYAATEAGVRRVLNRRIDRWARSQPDRDAAEPTLLAARSAVDKVVKRLAETGAISDAAFAENRARSLSRSGQSTRSIQMRLIAKGVARDIALSVSVGDAETELAAALVLTRKRRIGPYRAGEVAEETVRREMGLLARAGFSRDVAQRALDIERDDAERRIFALRQ
jgi:regulatory protein